MGIADLVALILVASVAIVIIATVALVTYLKKSSANKDKSVSVTPTENTKDNSK